jgi:hypothetical protein
MMIMVFLPHLSALNYLDPGSGSLIVQLVLGALLAVGLGMQIFWGKIKMLFKRKSPRKGDSNGDDGTGD